MLLDSEILMDKQGCDHMDSLGCISEVVQMATPVPESHGAPKVVFLSSFCPKKAPGEV